LAQKSKKTHTEKTNLHVRNLHRDRYDFKRLIQDTPELAKFVSINPYGDESVDFSNPDAVKSLNKALLKHFYGISYWDIPENYLCPPIPGRADYIHYIADLLGLSNQGKFPVGKAIRVLDIGTGANCVYPIIGHREYGWRFVGSDIDPVAYKSASRIIENNPSLEGAIECRLQTSSQHIFKDIIKPGEFFDATLCNPPFHTSLAEAQAGTARKLTNLGLKKSGKQTLNFGGQNAELWSPGGEEAFVKKMISESVEFKEQCLWFTSLISKKTTLPGVYAALKTAKVFEVKTIEMAQGQKVSRFVAWTFFDKNQQAEWSKKRQSV
jgi:23S rRNA (adenine1618-N6)-methyltransferase